jgi:hypothetical protein
LSPKSKGLISGARPVQAFLVLFFFIFYLLLYLEIATLVLGRISLLSNLSKRDIPAFRNVIPGFNYIGFVIPLAVDFFALILLFRNSWGLSLNFRRVIIRDKYWLFAALLSVCFWYLIPGFASGGHTDFPLAIFTCVYVGWYLEGAKLRRSILISIVLGLGSGL